ncbi:MAG: hypothetical protein Q8M76_12840, partial [Spirochaetaceae bacterium]|nr:hypothetical protein [Spirochaetaceae bacterium]
MKRVAFIAATILLAALIAIPAFGADLKGSLALESTVLALKSADNQLLLAPSKDSRAVPKRPADPNKLPETDPLHWYDMEWAGWSVTPTNLPKSPADGAIGKKVIMIVHGDHP